MEDELCAHRARPYNDVMDGTILAAELERFANEAVAAGRFRDGADLVAAGVGLLPRQEQARAAFVASLKGVEAESDREGWHSLGDILAEADEIIASMRELV